MPKTTWLDKEEWDKRTRYNSDNERSIIRNMQKCQRNWDYTKGIPPEKLDHLLWIAENSPSKQHEAYYDVYYTRDRKVLEELSKYTWGCTHNRTPPSTWRNSQMNAGAYILFVAKEPETQQNCNADGTLKENNVAARWENAYVSIGIAIGLVMRSAHQMGFATGCNKSHGDLNGDNFWEKKLGILEDVEAGRKKITYGIGIGHPKEYVPRYESDETELAIGAGNGSNLATDTSLKENKYGKPYRHIKIIDIKKHAGEEIEDHYGNKHKIPDVANIKINTPLKRTINVTEIK